MNMILYLFICISFIQLFSYFFILLENTRISSEIFFRAQKAYAQTFKISQDLPVM